MNYTVTITVNNNGEETILNVSGTKAEVLEAQGQAIQWMKPGATITMTDTATGRQISQATKPRR